jgi:hypothetical protein
LAAQAVEARAAGDLPAQHVHERHVVALEDAEERGHVIAPVVDHLAFRALVAAEEDPAHAHERFGIERVGHRIDALDQTLGQHPLAPDVGRGRADRGNRAHGIVRESFGADGRVDSIAFVPYMFHRRFGRRDGPGKAGSGRDDVLVVGEGVGAPFPASDRHFGRHFWMGGVLGG